MTWDFGSLTYTSSRTHTNHTRKYYLFRVYDSSNHTHKHRNIYIYIYIYTHTKERLRNLNKFHEKMYILGIKLSREVLDSLVKILYQWVMIPSDRELCSTYLFNVFSRCSLHICTYNNFPKYTHKYVKPEISGEHQLRESKREREREKCI